MLEGREAAAQNGAKSVGEAQDGRLALLSIADLTAIRNLIRGGSVIDWHRLYFADREQVDQFLRIHEFDPGSAPDMARLEALREQAVDYLEHHLGFHIAEEIAERIPARDLLLVASQNGKRRTHACVVLKVMHVLQHLAGRELVNRLSVSADQIFHASKTKSCAPWRK